MSAFFSLERFTHGASQRAGSRASPTRDEEQTITLLAQPDFTSSADDLGSSAGLSTWRSCCVCASDTVALTGQLVAEPGVAYAHERSGDRQLTGQRTSWGSACAGSDQMTAPPDQATAGWSRSQRPWIRSVPTQDSVVVALNGRSSKPGALGESPTSRRARPGRATAASALAAAPASLCLCHGCSNGGGRLLLPNVVVEPSHDCSALKE